MHYGIVISKMSLKMEFISRIFKPPENSYFLFGPRGTGKSTFIRIFYGEALYLDMLDPEIFRSYAAAPERLRERLSASPEISVVIIDEIQKLPELLSVAHSLIEDEREIKLVLTGSSSRKLKRSGVDLLAGRALLCRLHPFMAAELGDRFNLERALHYGLLPIVLDSDTPEKVLEAYTALYIKEEVQAEGVVRNIGSFSRFVEAASFSHGSVLNISNISRECGVNRKTVEGYIGVLEDLLLAYRIPVFTRRAKRAVTSHPKFYIFDAGVYRSIQSHGPLDRPEEIEGIALEGLVAEHLRSWIDYSDSYYDLYFWRTRAGNEVDFVIYGGDEFCALEVKNSSTIHPADLNGLKAFREEYPQCRTILLYRGKERLMKAGILCLPCEEFLKSLEPHKQLI